MYKWFRNEFHAMGCPCEIQLFSRNRIAARRMFAIGISEIQRLEKLYSSYRSDSFLSTINQVAKNGGKIDVDDETAGLLNYAQTCWQESDGLFDITSGILRHAWRHASEKIPSDHTLQSLLAKTGWQKLHWNPPILGFSVAGMEIDLGGVVKEYAADRVANLCHEAGAHSGLVNLGGDVKIIGPRPDGIPWRIGIRHPRYPGQLLRTLSLFQGGLASSGDYERCIFIDGIRYGHILNPKNGWPTRYLAAVSVIGDLCMIAGSASTIAMLKEEEGPHWLKNMGLRHYWVDVNGNTGDSFYS